jgi:CO/xanthine dehydrogenase Mo-binding subunit
LKTDRGDPDPDAVRKREEKRVQELRYVGGSYPVHDVAQKVTGELVYGSDFTLPGMLHAKLVLSPVPHGIVRRVDASRAEGLPGVVKVFSCFNSPMTTFCRARIHPGQDLATHDETLFSERVRFVGDRVAAVVATTRAAAVAAAALVEVEYEELPALLTVDEALSRDDVPIHPGGNLVYEYEVEKGAAPATEDALVVTSATSTPRVHHAALEPHVCVAQGHGGGGVTVWTTSQGSYAAAPSSPSSWASSTIAYAS